MIQKGANAVENRQEALKLAIDVLKSQPNLLLPTFNGTQLAERICSMAEAFIPYIIDGKVPVYREAQVQ